ncbi:MAG: hypothetical protein ACRENP_23035, partial [Longimicrobiales bacterium]
MRSGLSLIVFCVALAAAAPSVRAQESRLVGRLPDATRTQVEGILEAARAAGLPTEPLVDRV